MNREIKFRVWDKENKRMLKYDIDIVPCLTLNGVLQDCSKEVSSNVSYKYELMQFTGLKDENGVGVYEFMELDNQYEVIYVAPKYVLRNISNGDIIDLYENKHTITKEYTKI